MPTSYTEFAEELEQALKPWVGVPPPLIPVEAPARAATTGAAAAPATAGAAGAPATAAAGAAAAAAAAAASTVEAPAHAAAPALQRLPTAGSLPDDGVWADGKGKKADPIELSPTLTQLDLSFAAQTIMANVKGPNAVLYGHAASATDPDWHKVWRGAETNEKFCVSAPRVVAALSSTRLLLTRWPRRRSH